MKRSTGIVCGLFVALSLAACSSAPVVTNGDNVKLYSAPPPGCHYVGEAMGTQTSVSSTAALPGSTNDAGARRQLRDRAAEMGGDALVVQKSQLETRTTVAGSIYRCK